MYKEPVKNFNKIRGYIREFYINGFKSRQDYTIKSSRSYDNEKHFTLPLRYQALVAGMDGIGQVTVKPDALQIVTGDANRLWTRLQEEGCSIQEIEVTNRSLLDSIFENTKEVG